MARRTILAAVLTIAGVVLGGVVVWMRRPGLEPIEISQQTTYILQPTRGDGWVDYPGAVDWMRRASLDAGGTNAAGPLAQALAPGVLPSLAAGPPGGDPAPEAGAWLRQRCGAERDKGVTQARLVDWVGRAEAPLANLAAAAEGKSLYVPATQTPRGTSFARVDPARLRDAARALRCRAAVRLLQGDVAASWKDVEAFWRLGLLLAQSPTAVEYEAAAQLWRQAMTGTVDLAAHAAAPAEMLSTAQRSLAAISEFPPATEPLRISRIERLDGFATPLVVKPAPGTNDAGPRAPAGTAARLAQINAQFDALDAALQIADPKQRIARFRQAVAPGAPSDPIARVLDDEVAAVADRRLALIALALAARRKQAGGWPATLAELGDLPKDPATGEAFRYLPAGPGFRVYGVGPDGRDDGGDPAKDEVAIAAEPPRVAPPSP